MLDLLIIAAYFVGIMLVGVLSRTKADTTAEEFIISSLRLR